ncbi:uncharacterized protein LOC111697327 isoform X2 [Eurytemora carolleeae]|uniref:uncharacterized protein LOC111697327 isoform X2 n=1 Tax=Eurytemora carolleeae TaxID=1294199 RepID=UPI000C766158|nr:uncharacterized protein LOC111697327 isoform X2 [Eurytemora carolleeae]|eukprot:XP_023323049.1 uncharacterized protein LOC111697327 isoform X2 [Eurytemora affinis]
MDNLIFIFLLSIGLLVAVGCLMMILFIILKRRKKNKSRRASEIQMTDGDNRQHLLHQQQQHMMMQQQQRQQQFQRGQTQEVEPHISECLTCSLIQMGSSVSYSDNTCTQCGRSTIKS